MTEQRAIDNLRFMKSQLGQSHEDIVKLKTFDAAITALEKSQQYQVIGTVKDIKDRGHIEESKYAYEKITSFKAIEGHYENKGEPPYIKYNCPICSMLGNRHQITRGDKQCPLCGINLKWD